MIEFNKNEMKQISLLTYIADSEPTEIESELIKEVSDEGKALRLMRIGGLIEHLSTLLNYGDDIEDVHNIDVEGIIKQMNNADRDCDKEDILSIFVTDVAERAYRLGYIQHVLETQKIR